MSARLDHPPGLSDLTTLVRDCSVSDVPRRVLLLRTDLLPERLSRPHHIRLAHESLDPLMGADRARRYDLAHDRVAISWRGDAAARLRLVLDALEHLMLDAPLDAPSLPELVRLFDLPRDGAALLAVSSRLSASAQRAQDAEAIEAAPAPLPPLDPRAIEVMEGQLASASVARFTRRRMVCRMGASTFSPAWETRFLSIGELIAELAPGRNPYANIWLFRRLTRVLDRRMLALLSSPAELRGAGPFSLNLNVGGILSPEFLRFDAALPAALRGHAVLDLHPADVMADLPSYRFARAFARARGYRVLLRALSPTLIGMLDLPALDLDFVELRWEPGLAGLDPARLQAGTARWVLARVDEPEALRWGVKAGIGLFQGDSVQAGKPIAPSRAAA